MYEEIIKTAGGMDQLQDGGLMVGVYVTAYTDGVKSEDEAKWKSDGTQFKTVVSSGSNLNKDKPSSTNPTALDEEIDNTISYSDLNLVTEDTVITPSDPIVVPDTEGANELDSVSIDADALIPVPSVIKQLVTFNRKKCSF